MTAEEIFACLEEKFGAKRETLDKWGVTAVVSAAYLRNAVQFLRDEAAVKFDMLVDIAGIDYLTYPNHEGPRFAVSYSFKTVADGATREANCRNISSTYLCESGHGLPQYALSEGTSSVG